MRNERLLVAGMAWIIVGHAFAAPLGGQELAVGAEQTTASVQRAPRAPHAREVEFWGGLAQNSPRWGVLGETPSMNLALFALRFVRTRTENERVNASRRTTFHIDVVPLALLSPPYISLRGTPAPDCKPGALCLRASTTAAGLFPAGSAIGVGVSPIGITTHFREDRLLSPSFGFTGGALMFDRAVPTDRASAFNFTASLEAGLRIGPPDRAGIIVNYRFHHISNAGTGRENTGIASHLISVGLRSPRQVRAATDR